MATLLVLYKHPEDPAAFDAHYNTRHVPLAKSVPGLKRFEVSRGPVVTPQGASSYPLVARLEFDSLAALGKGLASPEGQATGADLAKFAQAGVELLVFETAEI